jgi:hypothetical protein
VSTLVVSRCVDVTEVELPAFPQSKEDALALYKAARPPMSSKYLNSAAACDAVLRCAGASCFADGVRMLLVCFGIGTLSYRVVPYCRTNDGCADWYVDGCVCCGGFATVLMPCTLVSEVG